MTHPDGHPSGARRTDGASHARDDRGSVAVLMCFIVLIGATLVTFLVDAGAQLQAASRADSYAAEAARAASIAVGPLPTGNPGGDSASGVVQAAQAARTFLAHAGATGTVRVLGPATVSVTVTVTQQTLLLDLTVSQTRTHTAQLQVGVRTGQGVS